jgi:3-isopropylmalate/(R)-2-methylmalate dehydratase large subunit
VNPTGGEKTSLEITTRGKTIAEKILSRASGCDVRAGDIAVCLPDYTMGTDGSIPMAMEYLQLIHGDGPLPAPYCAKRVVFAFDHYGPSSGGGALALQAQARSYAHAHGIRSFEAGDGIGHQRMMECGLVLPGRLVAGADSHASTYGALNAFGTGIGSSDLAGVMLCGQLWFRVPHTMRVILQGRLKEHVSAKDLALALARQLGTDGANYLAMEFDGPGVATLDINDRIVLANMSVEMGAKAGLFPCDTVTAAYLNGRSEETFEAVSADASAYYKSSITFDMSTLRPQVALPHRVDHVIDLADAPETPIDMVYLGTCTGGRSKDYREALDVLRAGGGLAPGVSLIVTPASAAIRAELEETGMLAEFVAFGAEIHPPGCGACCGTSGRIPQDGRRIVSTANRNFKGRMGNPEALIYLASPKACAAAATRGALVDPGAIGR